MKIYNDNNCGWINDLPKRENLDSVCKVESCDFFIVGVGYTGLSAARKLGSRNPSKKIILVDVQFAGKAVIMISLDSSGFLALMKNIY